MTGRPVKLDPATPEVQRLTRRALEASRAVPPSLIIRCADCGAKLAQAGYTPAGPLFTSSWVEAPELGITVYTAEGELDPFAAERWLRRHHGPEGAHRPPVDRDGTIALLTLPPGTADDFPDLVVRCNAHGDAVLDRVEVLAWLREKKRERKVNLTVPTCQTR